MPGTGPSRRPRVRSLGKTIDRDMQVCAVYANAAATERRTAARCWCPAPWKEYPGDEQSPSHRPARPAGERPRMVTTTEILAVIGGTTLVLTAAARVPAALAEFLRACILVATAARELRAALAERSPCDHLTHAGDPGTPGAQDSGH